MRITIVTLFPEFFDSFVSTSIIKRALDRKQVEFDTVDFRKYTLDKHNHVDDTPCGGGQGMVLSPQPIVDCLKDIRTPDSFVVMMSPQGATFTQKTARQFASEIKHLILLCGHYEGIDERVLEEIVTDYVSIGDYVLTGGELPAMVMVDAISRMVPGVLTNDESGSTESFEGNLLEYPQYSRPEEWMGKKVPSILLSGDHKKVDEWRREQAILRTIERRPDLLKKAELTKKEQMKYQEYLL